MSAVNQKAKVEALIEELKHGVYNVYSTETYTQYLDFVSSFPTYSVNNQILLFTQDPTCSYVCGFRQWEKMGRHVKRGEHSLKIIAPVPYQKEIEVKQDDGTVTMDKVDQIGYRAVSVFDIKQTEGEPVPEYIHNLVDPVADFYGTYAVLEGISLVPIEFKDIQGSANGFYSPKEQKIVIKRDMSESQTIKTLVHEMAHAALGHGSDCDKLDRSTKELQAESIAYIVCRTCFDLDVSDYSFPYVAGWAKDKDLKQLKDNLDVIRKHSLKMIDDIQQSMELTIKHDRNIDITEAKIDAPKMKMAM